MELTPTEPPGHARRKLRGLVSEIARLRAQGYTIRAIHQALGAAGIKVGWATVQREVARLSAAPAALPKATRPAVQGSAGNPVGTGASTRPAVDVDLYFDQHNTNPLFRQKGSKG